MKKICKNFLSLLICFTLIFGVVPPSILSQINFESSFNSVVKNLYDFFEGLKIKAEAAETDVTLESTESSLKYDIFTYTLYTYSDGTKEITINNWTETSEVIIPEEINGILVTCIDIGDNDISCDKIIIPATIIKSDCRYGSISVNEVYYEGTLEQYLFWVSNHWGFGVFTYEFGDEHFYDLYINNELVVDLIISSDEEISIGSFAFDHCKSLKSASFISPYKIRNMKNAFKRCPNLEELVFTSGSTYVPDFTGVRKLKKYCGAYVSSDEIPSSVTELILFGNPDVKRLEDYTVEKLTYMGYEGAVLPERFVSYCPNLKELTIGNDIVEINMPLFVECKNLETISIPFIGNTREATEGRFSDLCYYWSNNNQCQEYLPTSIKTIHVTDDLTIPDCAFYNRERTLGNYSTYTDGKYGDGFFATVYIHGDIETIGQYAFAYDKRIISYADKYVTKYKDFGVDVIFVNAYTEEELLNRKPGTIKFPKSLTEVGYRAFYYNTDINYVYFNADTSFVYSGLCYNGNLSVDYEDGIVYFPGVEYCEGITELHIPSTVEYIGPFTGCPDLVDVTIVSDKIKNLDVGTFQGTPYFSNNIYYINNTFMCIDLFDGPYMLGVHTERTIIEYIPEGIVTIGSADMKAGQRNPDGMFVIADSVVTLYAGAFEGNYYDEGPYIYNLFLGENLEYIGYGCFENQWRLEKVYMNKNVKYIGENAFYYTPKFTDLYYYGSPEEFDKIEKDESDFSKVNIHYYYRPDITSVSVISRPTKNTYFKGELLDLTGLKVKVTYADGTSKIIIKDLDKSCYGFSGAVGVNTITVDIGGVTCTFDVTVNAVVPVELTVISLPSKLEYNLNEEIDLTGLKLQVAYNDGHVVEISKSFTCDTKVFNSLGVHTVTITYNGLSITFEVNVIIGENHEHSYDLIYLLKDPTCVDSGLLCCECNCGDYFVENLEPLGHDLTDVWTYSSNGVFIKTCSTCSLPYESKNVTLSLANNVELTNMQSLQLKASTTDNFDWTISWFSSDPSIVSVDYSSGKITANNVGVAEITAKLNGTDVQAVCTVTVNPRNFYTTWIVDDKIERIVVPEGTTITEPEIPIKTGYNFDGWTPAVPETMPSMNMTFTAAWSLSSYTVTWIIDGVNMVETYHYGDIINVPDVPEKTGFSFDGWSSTVAETMPEYNLEYTAVWKPNVHNVSFIVNGEQYLSFDCTYSEIITVPDNPQIEGYDFIGWTPSIPETMIDSDLTFTAVFELATYTATFVADDVIVSTQTFTIETENLIEPPVPQKAGYYACWEYYDIIAEDITIDAKYFLPDVVMVSKHTLDVGDSYRLLTSCNFEVTSKVWKSTDTCVATVNQYGKVTAVGEGECRITVVCYGKDSLGNDIQATESTEIIVKEQSNTVNVKKSFREMFDEFFEVTLHDLVFNLREFLIILFKYTY